MCMDYWAWRHMTQSHSTIVTDHCNDRREHCETVRFTAQPFAERNLPGLCVQVRAAAQVLFDTKHFLKDYGGMDPPPGWDGAVPPC